MANLAALRGQIADWVRGRQCAALGGNIGDGGAITLSGLAGEQTVDALRQGIASFAPPGQVDWHVDGINRVFCPALNALRPLVPAFGSVGSPRLGLQMADGRTRLHDGDEVKVLLTMPDFAGRLRVDYVGHDGSVLHLYPQVAEPKAQITGDPPRMFSAGETVNLANPRWLISEPYGTDMIMAVAASQPLFDHARPSNEETADVYLRDLQAAIDAARQRGVSLAGTAITLDALPK